MSQLKQVFVDIDTQFDFMDPKGSLYVPGAERLEPQLRKLLSYAQEHQIPVVASVDAHDPHDPEFQIFPPHCVQGSEGQKKCQATYNPEAKVIANQRQELDLNQLAHLVLEKTVFDIFGNPNAEAIFKHLDAQEYVVFGVATDYCVKAAALGLRQRGYNVSVVTDAIAPVTAQGGAESLDAFKQAGIHFRTTAEITGG